MSRTGEWSERGLDRFSVLLLNRFGILETNMSKMSGRFRGEVGQYVGLWGEMIV